MTTTLGSATTANVIATVEPWRWPWIHLFQPSHFVVRSLELAIESLPASLVGFRIADLSDLHLTRHWHSAYERVIDTVAVLQADLVLLNGDIVDDRRNHLPAMPVVSRFLPRLRSRLGTYAILGNHDNQVLAEKLERIGVRMLDGQRTVIETDNGGIELIGAPGPMRHHMPPDFATRFAPRLQGVPRIVAAHFPDHFPKLQVLDPDVYLCGHTHAGQICLPNGFAPIRHDASPRRLCRGYHRIGRTHYIVNHGLGFSGVSIRVFCTPEIVLVTLRQG